MKISLNFTLRTTLALLVMATSLAACNIGSYDDAVARFNENAPPPPPPGPPEPPPPPPPGGFGPTFSEIQANVFTPSCATANCHAGGNPDADLNLEAANSYAMLVGIASSQQSGLQRVNPGNPDMSYLIQKLEGAAGITGGQMPPGAALPQAEIDVIRQWITDGAADDQAQSSSAIQVAAMSPAPGATLGATPQLIIVGFDRQVDASTVHAGTFILQASGNDGTFGDGNENLIGAASISVPHANPRSAVFDLGGHSLADDTYRVLLSGSGASTILDLDANALGDASGDGIALQNGTGGAGFEAFFTVVNAPQSDATSD